MSKMPKWMADVMERSLKNLYFVSKVIHKEKLSPELLKITFQIKGEIPVIRVGDAVSIRVSETEFRNYTPIMESEDTFSMIFQLHHGTVGHAYLINLQVDDSLKMVIPRGRLSFNIEVKRHVLFCDESALGFALQMVQECTQYGKEFILVVESNPANKNYISQQFKPQYLVDKGDWDEALEAYFEYHEPSTVFYLLGNAASIQQAKRYLKIKDIKVKQIYAQAFWAEGKKGL